MKLRKGLGISLGKSTDAKAFYFVTLLDLEGDEYTQFNTWAIFGHVIGVA